MSNRGYIRSLRSLFHIWKLVSQRAHTALKKPLRNSGHKWMGHAGARTMSEHVTSAGSRRHLQNARYAAAANRKFKSLSIQSQWSYELV